MELKSKKGKIVLYATTFAIMASTVGFTLCRNRAEEFADYITNYAEEIVDDEFNVSAHRGFSSLEVENTIEAISLAAEKDYVDYIEIDARLTKDGKIVLSHNNALLVAEDKKNVVSSLYYDQIENMEFIYLSFPLKDFSFFNPENMFVLERNRKLNNRRYRLCTLKEGLKCCGDKKVFLDLKFNNDIEAFCQELQQELCDVDTSNIIFQSLSIPGILYLQDNTDYNCQVLISSGKDLEYTSEFDRVGIKYDLVNSELIDSLLDEGKEVSIWTINNTSTLNGVIEEAGEHYTELNYITDYPDLIVTRLHEKQKVLTKS